MEQLNIGWWFLILLGGITIFVFFGQTFIKVLKWSSYVILQFAIGSIILIFFNMIGQLIDIRLPLNLVTAFVVGILGLPGLFTLIIIKLFIIQF